MGQVGFEKKASIGNVTRFSTPDAPLLAWR
jgi:hypothetical protein